MSNTNTVLCNFTLLVCRCWRWRRNTWEGCLSVRMFLRAPVSAAEAVGLWRWKSLGDLSYFPCVCTSCPCSAVLPQRIWQSVPGLQSARSYRSWNRPSESIARYIWLWSRWWPKDPAPFLPTSQKPPCSRQHSTGKAARFFHNSETCPTPLLWADRTQSLSGCHLLTQGFCSRIRICWPEEAQDIDSMLPSASTWWVRCARCPASALEDEPVLWWRHRIRHYTGMGFPIETKINK